MDVIIIEDEKPAADKLEKAISAVSGDARVIAVLHSLGASRNWLTQYGCPDLIFMDIELSDGSSLDLFKERDISCPVIFTTAYDEYWQAAFEHNGIDYLLKPIREEKLAQALGKYNLMKTYFAKHLIDLTQHNAAAAPSGYKTRFLVKRGTEYQGIPVENIAYFQSAHKLVCLVTREGGKFMLDQSLSDLEKQLDPARFFRLNRKYIVAKSAVGKIRSLPKSKLDVELLPGANDAVTVSQENASAFKAWMSR